MTIVLWIIQALLALAFLLAGFMKGFGPLETLKKNMAWTNEVPAGLVRFIGIAELLGAIGLILPEAMNILPWLTIAAAVGLAIVMILAVGFHVMHKEWSTIAPSVVLFLLAAFIVIGRLVWGL